MPCTPRGPYACIIELQQGANIFLGKIYSLSEPHLRAQREYLDENLANILPILLHFPPPIPPFPLRSPHLQGHTPLCLEKWNGNLCLYINYQALNNIAIKNQYPLPLINELLERVS